MDERSSKILEYSESDFPSLDPNNRRKSTHRTKPGQLHIPRNNDTRSEPARKSEVSSSFRSDKNSFKVLKPSEHKESYSINVSEAIAKTANQTTTTKKIPIRVKSNARDEHVSGNPLDSDNPLRLKGKFGMPKKPKRMSRTKKTIMLARENVRQARVLAEDIIIEKECIRYDTKLEGEDLRNVLYLARLAELRKMLKSPNEESVDEADLSKKEQRKDVLSDLNVADFRKIVETSSVPAHLLLIHNHNFKKYCDNCLSNALNETATALVSQIVRFQQSKYQKNPVKAVANKRFVLGFKQTTKYTRMNKVKMIICVPDMEDGMSELVEELKSLATAYSIPYLFALTRRKLGALSFKKVGVCCFGIMDYSSAEGNFNRVREEALNAKRIYRERCSAAQEYCQLYLGLSSRENEHGVEELNTDAQVLVTDIQEKLRFNEEGNVESEQKQVEG